MTSTFKKKVYAACVALLDERISSFQELLRDLTDGAENDSKSSAGDKHETSRAMMQLEHEKISRQLDETIRQRNELEKILPGQAQEVISKGSLIKTNQGYLFLSVAIGKIIEDETSVIVLSPQSPLGINLAGRKRGDTVEMNRVQYKILEVQ